MAAQLKRVPGGWELHIPDDVAAQIGLAEGVETEVRIGAEELIVSCPEYRRAVLKRMCESITPETLHDPYEPYEGLPEVDGRART